MADARDPAPDSGVISEAVLGQPGRTLRTAIASYHGYRQRGLPPALHLGLPSPFLTFIVTLDEPLHVAQHVDPSRPGSSYDTLVGGLHTTPAVIAHDGAQSGIQLAVSPLAARRLLGVPAGELAGIDTDARDVIGRLATELRERTCAATTWPQRFAALDRLFDTIATEQPAPPPAVRNAWSLLMRTRGTIPIAHLAEEVGYSQRRLGTLFRIEIGLSPKHAGRAIRFDRARRLLQSRAAGPAGDRTAQSIARIAVSCGYYDQSHLVRDFVAFTGRAPSRWLAEEFGNIQATAPYLPTGLAS